MMDTKNIYITFDDGPLEPYTSDILETLKTFNAHATFFVCGKNIERSPQSLRRIAEAGHAIGNHTYSHNAWKVIRGTVDEEIETTDTLIQTYSGHTSKLYRSPWGIPTPGLKSRLARKGYTIYHWNIMAFDWWQPSPEFMANHIIKRASPGAIIVLHDGDQISTGNRERTVQALRIVLTELSRRGYSFKRLDGSYNNPRGTLRNMMCDIFLGGIACMLTFFSYI